MPQIIPIRDLKNTSEISDLCHSNEEPVFITKNGYGDMVIMSIETYEKTMFMNDVYKQLEDAEKSVASGDVQDALESLKSIREKYNV